MENNDRKQYGQNVIGETPTLLDAVSSILIAESKRLVLMVDNYDEGDYFSKNELSQRDSNVGKLLENVVSVGKTFAHLSKERKHFDQKDDD